MVGGRQTQVFHFKFEPHRPCAIGYNASSPVMISVVRSDTDGVWTVGTNVVGVHRQHTGHGNKNGVVPVTVRVHNQAKQPAQVQLWVN